VDSGRFHTLQSGGRAGLFVQEAEQDFVDLATVRPEHAVRGAFDFHVLSGWNTLGELSACCAYWEDAVLRSMDNQGRDGDLLDVGTEVRQP